MYYFVLYDQTGRVRWFSRPTDFQVSTEVHYAWHRSDEKDTSALRACLGRAIMGEVVRAINHCHIDGRRVAWANVWYPLPGVIPSGEVMVALRSEMISSRYHLLSVREREVLFLMGFLSTADIAEKLSVSVSTIESHRRAISAKVGASTLGEVIEFALHHRLAREIELESGGMDSDGCAYPDDPDPESDPRAAGP